MKICISQFLREFQRATSCISNDVSHKCVLAFIAKVDKSEWMLWRDCDNSARSIIWYLSKEVCWLSCWSLTILQMRSEMFVLVLTCAFWPVQEVIFETVPTSWAQLFYYVNIFFNVFTLGQFIKFQSKEKMSLTF